MRTAAIVSATIILTLTSCEGFVHFQGCVFDSTTNKPLEGAQILLVFNRNDTDTNLYFEYDSLSYKERTALRKSGVKDDYRMYNVGGLSKKPTLLKTDTNGFFTTGIILVPCVPKCPTCQLVFLKEGYQNLALKLNAIASDTVSVLLQRTSIN